MKYVLVPVLLLKSLFYFASTGTGLGVLLEFKSVSIFDVLNVTLSKVLLFKLFEEENFNDVLLFRLFLLYFPIKSLFFFCTGTSLCVERIFRSFILPDNLPVTTSADSSSCKNGITQQKTMRKIQINPRIIIATMKPALLEGSFKMRLSKGDK